jgi:hypothetical protein
MKIHPFAFQYFIILSSFWGAVQRWAAIFALARRISALAPIMVDF